MSSLDSETPADSPFTPEQMHAWLLLPPDEFIALMIEEIRREMLSIRDAAGFLQLDSPSHLTLPSQDVPHLAGIMQATHRIEQLVEMLSAYRRAHG